MGNKGERDGSSVSQVRGCSVLMRLIGRSTTCQRLGSDETDTPYSLDQNDNNISRRYLETVELRNLLHMVKTTLPPNNRGITQSSSFASLAPTMIPGVPRFYGVSCARCLARFRSGAGSQASPLEGIGKHAAMAWGVISSPSPAVPSYSKLYEGCYHARSMGPD